ncbi:MAG TPA: lysoplasmalogenase [Candidatus Binatia bacterium]|nr:lysoplasmalogenase [Candidatus Binatia bacterium]
MWTAGITAAGTIGAAHIATRYAGRPAIAGLLKGVPIALLAALVAAEPSVVGERYRWLVFAALLCSLAGDLCLVFRRGFVPGLLSFLVAHVLYVTAFAPVGPGTAAAAGIFGAMSAFGMVMVGYLWRHLGRMRVPVMVYVIVIIVMGWSAVRRGLAPGAPGPSGMLALVGALFFMVSDGVLAVARFARAFPAADAVVMTTYYLAQALIALSVRA